jgi:hypothetical protein
MGLVYTSRSDCLTTIVLVCFASKLPYFKLKTQPKQLLRYLPLIPIQAENACHASQSIKTNESYITLAPGEVKLPGHRLGVPLETGRTNNVVRLVIFDRFGILLIMNRSSLYKSVDIVCGTTQSEGDVLKAYPVCSTLIQIVQW